MSEHIKAGVLTVFIGIGFALFIFLVYATKGLILLLCPLVVVYFVTLDYLQDKRRRESRKKGYL